MFLNDNLKQLQCAATDEKHFVIAPIEMQCGHFVCKNCLKFKRNGIIKCAICDKKNRFDLNELKESHKMNQFIATHMSQLIATLEKEFLKTITNLKGINLNLYLKIFLILHFFYLKYFIYLRKFKRNIGAK